MFLFTYFVLPAPTTTLDGIADWFQPFFDEFWPWGLLVIGITLSFFLIKWVVSLFHKD